MLPGVRREAAIALLSVVLTSTFAGADCCLTGTTGYCQSMPPVTADQCQGALRGQVRSGEVCETSGNCRPDTDWRSEDVESRPEAGNLPALAFDRDGHTHLTHYDHTTRTLRHAFWDGLVWRSEPLVEDVTPAEGGGDFASSVAVDSLNEVNVAYEYTTLRCFGGERHLRTCDPNMCPGGVCVPDHFGRCEGSEDLDGEACRRDRHCNRWCGFREDPARPGETKFVCPHDGRCVVRTHHCSGGEFDGTVCDPHAVCCPERPRCNPPGICQQVGGGLPYEICNGGPDDGELCQPESRPTYGAPAVGYVRSDGVDLTTADPVGPFPEGSLESGPAIGQDPVLAVDPSGDSHIVRVGYARDAVGWCWRVDGADVGDLRESPRCRRDADCCDAPGPDGCDEFTCLLPDQSARDRRLVYSRFKRGAWRQWDIPGSADVLGRAGIAIDDGYDTHVAFAACERPHRKGCPFGARVVRYARAHEVSPDVLEWDLQLVAHIPDYPQWQIGDHPVVVNRDVAIALDAGGLPHIAFVGRAEIEHDPDQSLHEFVHVAHFDGLSFQIDELDVPNDDYTLTGNDFGLAFAGSVLHLARRENDGFYHVTRDDAGWGAPTHVREPGFNDQLAFGVDHDGVPHVALPKDSGRLTHLAPGPRWRRELVDFDAESPALAVDLFGVPHVSYGRLVNGALGLAYATWDPPSQTRSWRGEWRITDLPAGGRHTSIALPFGGTPTPRISSYDPGRGDLDFSFFNSPAWSTTTVDSTGDVGQYSALRIRDGDTAPAIAYWDATLRRVKIAQLVPGRPWSIRPLELTTAASGPETGHVAFARGRDGMDWVSYFFDFPGSPQVRLARYDALTEEWKSDGFVTGSEGGGPPSAIGLVDPDQRIAIAYPDATGRRLQVALNAVEPAADEPDPVTAVSLATRNGSVHLAYVTGDRVRMAGRRSSTEWFQEDVGDASAVSGVSLDLRGQDQLAYTVENGGVWYAARTETVDRGFPPYNPLRPCENAFTCGDGVRDPGEACDGDDQGDCPFGECFRCACKALCGNGVLDPGEECDGNEAERCTIGCQNCRCITPAPLPVPARAAALSAPRAPAALDDLAILRALRALFSGTPAGQRLIRLYYTHAPEAGAIGITEPGLLADAYLALRALLPGFAALVEGRGDRVYITQDDVDRVNAVIDRILVRASIPLADAIRAERAAYDDLQRFVGMTYRRWASEIGVEGGATTTTSPAGSTTSTTSPTSSSTTTTTTVPAAECVVDGDCEDGDSCTEDRCTPLGCTTSGLSGFALADCELEKLVAAALCGAEQPGATLARVLAKKVGQARTLLGRAAGEAAPKTRARLVAKAAKQLHVIEQKAARSRRTPVACRATVQQGAANGRRLVLGLRT